MNILSKASSIIWLASLVMVCCAVGCQETRDREIIRAPRPVAMVESVVLVGTKPGNLLPGGMDPNAARSIIVRSSYRPGGTVYERGRDYEVDARAGTVQRTAGSRIPDFAENVLYGEEKFDHTRFPGFGNLPFTVYVEYAAPAESLPRLTESTDQSDRLADTRAKLQAGGPFKLIAYGDSISAGGDASAEELRFQNRYAAHLSSRFSQSEITVETTATGGDNTVQGLARLEEKVLSRQPDLVLIGFGMNDHNRPGVGGVEPEQFQENLESMVRRIRERTGAEVILLSTFPPNPQWAFGTHRMEQYASATRAAADATGVAYADVYSPWMQVLERKDPASLLANHINHPNDFGHWLYLKALQAVGF